MINLTNPKDLVHLFEISSLQYAEEIALVEKDSVFNYNWLRQKSRKIGNFLYNKVGKDNHILLCMDRSPYMIASVIGILKSGNIYVPIDPRTSTIRINEIISQVKPELILTDSGSRTKFKHRSCLDINSVIDKLKTYVENSNVVEIDPNAIAFLTFTSGTTGKPKGVPIKHISLLNKILNFHSTIKFQKGDQFILLTSISFDPSIAQIFLPLVNGGTLHLVDFQKELDTEFFWDYVIKHKINVLYTFSSFLNVLLDYPIKRKPSLKYVFLGAELFPPKLLTKIKQKLNVHKIINMYGPTEVTVNATMYVIGPKYKNDGSAIPIGKPLPGYEVFFLDNKRNILAENQKGEIAISGVGLSPGYFKDGNQSDVKFIWKEINGKRKRIYLTGDLGWRDKDEFIHFVGRKDHQVKINGVRIELSGIEAIINQHPKVDKSHVVYDKRNKKILAFIESRNVKQKDIGDFLDENLPDYMRPNQFMLIDESPKLVNGKIDRRKLLQIAKSVNDSPEKSRYTSKNESLLLKIWSDIFEGNQIRVTDDFFELGGGSLQSVILVNRLRRAGIKIAPSDIFQYPTIKQLAKICDQKDTGYSDMSNIVPENDYAYNRPLRAVKKIPAIDEGLTNTRIETIAAYLPRNTKLTTELIKNCKNKVRFPLERFTGIKKRHVVSKGEFSYELASKAIERCLKQSNYKPRDVDLLICCNICKSIGVNQFLFEPCFSLMLKRDFKMTNAISFDLTNACAGMFTGVYLADLLIKGGAVKNALIVSGEYISQLGVVAQKEIEEEFFDQRLPCLTLGDAGVALIIDQSKNSSGINYIDLLSLSKFSDLCIAQMSKLGGPIMRTDSIRSSEVGIRPGIGHAIDSMKINNWKPEKVDHFILHQTSTTTIHNAIKELNSMMGKEIASTKNVIFNLENKGNTASTCQFLALHDGIKEGKIKPYDKVVFPVSGSGRTIGTALVSLDDLPTRMNRGNGKKIITKVKENRSAKPNYKRGAIIRSIQTFVPNKKENINTRDMNKLVAKKVLKESGIEKEQIDMVIYSGIYRDNYIFEPAIATFAAGDLGINHSKYQFGGPQTLCFDIFNGNISTWNALSMISHFIRSGRIYSALIISSDINNNKGLKSNPFPMKEVGAAILITASKDNSIGFSDFVFDYDTNYVDHKKVYSVFQKGQTFLKKEIKEIKSEHLIDLTVKCLERLFHKEKLNKNLIDKFLLTGLSEIEITKVANAMSIDLNKFELDSLKGDEYMSSQFSFNMKGIMKEVRANTKKRIVLAGVGSGLQISSVLYVI